MKDRDDKDLKQKPLESQERLETIAFHFNQLYQQLSQDRDTWAMTGGDLADVVESFEKQLQHLETLDTRLRQQLNESMEDKTRQATASIMTSFQQATKAVLAEDIKGTADHLEKIVQETHHLLSQYQKEIAGTKKWLLTLAFVSALLGSIGGVSIFYYLHP